MDLNFLERTLAVLLQDVLNFEALSTKRRPETDVRHELHGLHEGLKADFSLHNKAGLLDADVGPNEEPQVLDLIDRKKNWDALERRPSPLELWLHNVTLVATQAEAGIRSIL